jgi:predicted ATP-grasp superfamily ATP-dependent carboligase
MDVLVTGCDYHVSLAVLRSLGRKGIKVLAAGADAKSIGFYSRYASAKWVYPSPFTDKQGFVESVLRALQQYRVKLVFPAGESTLVVLDQWRTEIERWAPLAAASSASIDLSIDKVRTAAIAREVGVPVPETAEIRDPDQALVAAAGLGYPVILKKRGNMLHNSIPGRVEVKVAYAWTPENLTQALLKHSRNGYYPILQKCYFGVGVCVTAVMSAGEPLVLFAYRRSRENPITGGESVFRESIRLDERLKDYVIRLLNAMKWEGVAMVEFKYDETKDEYVLMEVNPRISLSTSLTLHAGADIPYVVYELFANRNKVFVRDYKVGVQCRWLRGDLNALENFLRGDTRREYPPEAVGRLPAAKTVLLDFLKAFSPRVKGDIFSPDDPLPGLVEFFRILKVYAGRLTRKLTKRGAKEGSP